MKSDKELIESLRCGDSFAFIALYNKYKLPLFTFCLKMVNNHDQASDIVQEIFIKVYEKYNKINNPDSFKSWIFTIARNDCYSALRKNKKLTNISSAEEIIGQEQPGNEYEKKENIAILTDSLNKLKYEDREIIVMKEYLNYSYQEISEILNLSNGAVKSRLFKARQRLYDILYPFYKGLI
jgi:RNA polymerase sigma-70 factor, ECF subfamily